MKNDNFQINVGVKLCSSCEHNIKCTECVYKKRYEALAEKHDALIGENQRLREELNNAKAKTIKEFECQLRNELSCLLDRTYGSKLSLYKVDDVRYVIEKVSNEMAGAKNGNTEKNH